MLLHSLIVLSFLYPLILATPRIHYGHCISKEGNFAACVSPEDCDYYPDRVKINPNFLKSIKCNLESSKPLICCPQYLANTKLIQPDVNAILPEAPNCGFMLAYRIFGGSTTEVNEHPWVAQIAHATNQGKQHLCGGVLLSSRWVLTAAHCVTALRSDQQVIGVRLGEWDTKQNPDCITIDFRTGRIECAPEHIDVSVDMILPHPLFDIRAKNFPHDIALLRLEHSVAFTQFVRPICLPLETFIENVDFTGLPGEVAGWGRTENNYTRSRLKLKAQLNIWQNKDCKEKLKTLRIPLDERHQFCAGGVEGIDTCQGDSGGPFMLSFENKLEKRKPFYVIGLVSFGKIECGTAGFPGVYTRVAPYVEWIKRTVAENQ